jgi:hypothetical protein
MSLSAFQIGSFQSNAFQIQTGSVVPPIPTDTHDGWTIKRHQEKLKHQSKLNEERLYKNSFQRPTLTIDLPEETKIAIAAAVNPLEVTNLLEQVRMRKLLDDDEEALTWLLQ